MNAKAYKLLEEKIRTKVFKTSSSGLQIISQEGANEDWIFDFRSILFMPECLDALVTLFWEKYEDVYPFQVGGLETSSIAIVSAIVHSSVKKNKPVNGFYIRKSRKKAGLMNAIEGGPVDVRVPIILVDDLINSGGSFEKVIKTLEDQVEGGIDIIAIFTILRYRDRRAYDKFSTRGISCYSLFELSSFTQSLGVSNLDIGKIAPPAQNPYPIVWRWEEPFKHYWKVKKVESFLVSQGLVFVGTDNGKVITLSASTGEKVSETKAPKFLFHTDIHSSISLSRSRIFFGSLQGGVYCADSVTGKIFWKNEIADSIDGPIFVDVTQKYVCFARLFTFLRKRSEIVCLSLLNGKEVWVAGLVLSPISGPYKSLCGHHMIILQENGELISLVIKNGREKWKVALLEKHVFQQAEISIFDGHIYVSALVKNESAYEAKLYKIHEKSGEVIASSVSFSEHQVNAPVLAGDVVVVTSVDKNVYFFSKNSLKLIRVVSLDSRIFAKPLVVKDGLNFRIFIGTNAARYVELEIENFKIVSVTYLSERILDSGCYDSTTKSILLRTQANQVFCLDISKRDGKSV